MTKANVDAHRRPSRKPYNERTDLEKLCSQWTKLSGLHGRDEPSAAIVRCATAAEIAANYAVRTEWTKKTEFDAAIVDQFLRWANGLPLKVERLLCPDLLRDPEGEPHGEGPDQVRREDQCDPKRHSSSGDVQHVQRSRGIDRRGEDVHQFDRGTSRP